MLRPRHSGQRSVTQFEAASLRNVTTRPTIIDLLDGWSGGVRPRTGYRQLGQTELDGLAERVRAFYEDWLPQTAPADVLRLSVAGRYFDAVDKRRLVLATLYGHEATFADPVERWAEAHIAGRIRSDGDERLWLEEAAQAVFSFEDLIRGGVAIPSPGAGFAREQRQTVESAFLSLMPDDSTPEQIEKVVTLGQEFSRLYGTERSTSIFLNVWGQLEDLGFADCTASTFPALNWHDWGFLTFMLHQAAAELRERHQLDIAVFAGLLSADLPMLATDPGTAARIRRDDAAFGSWRAELRAALRVIDDRRGNPDFEREAGEILEDLLAPRAEEVRNEVSRTKAFRKAAADQLTQFGLGAAGGVGIAEVFGTKPEIAAATAAIGAVSGWVIKTLFRPTPTGTSGIIAKLVQANPTGEAEAAEGGDFLVYTFPKGGLPEVGTATLPQPNKGSTD